MTTLRFTAIALLIQAVSLHSLSTAATISQAVDTDFLAVEAEAFDNDEFNDEFAGWMIFSPDSPFETPLDDSEFVGEIEFPLEVTNMSGAAIIDQPGKSAPREAISYSLKFENSGTYYMYARYSLFDLRKITSDAYGNENSFFVPFEDIEQDPNDADLQETRDGVITLSHTPASPFGRKLLIAADLF